MNSEKEVKSILKSLTLSSAKGITVSNLCRDYCEIVGSQIPFKAMGHPDLMSFLKSIPDTLVIAGTGMSALVIPVTDEKTIHLEEMIQKQRKPVAPKSKRSRYRAYDSRRLIIQRPRAIKLVTKSESNAINVGSCTLGESTNSFSRPNILPAEEIEEKFNNWNDSSSDDSLNISNYKRTSYENHSTPIVQNDTKLRVRATNNSYNDFAASSISRTFVDPFKDKLHELISKHPNGIWCSELPQCFKKHFNENLNVTEKGYCSVIHFCTSHSDIFHCVKPNKGDWKIYDVKHPIPTFDEVERVTVNSGACDESSNDVNKDSALPELDLNDILNFSNEAMPSDILQFGEKLPRQWLKIPDDGYITVRVTEIYDPSKFWLQLYSEDCSASLDELMNEMQVFYALNDTYNIPASDVQVGLYCVGLIYNEWHRGIVAKIEDPYIKVFYFDYGSVGKSLKNSLKYLHMKFCSLPRQAIRARLANIRPRHPAIMWSRDASKLLLELVNNRILVAEIINSLEIENHTLHVILTDTNDPNKDVHINDVLKKQGLAELMTNAYKVNTYTKNHLIKKFHYFLYPNHEDIENAVVPTIDEVVIMTSNGISLDMIFKPYINSIENGESYSFNFIPPSVNESYRMDFYISKNDVTETEEEDDSCVDEILPETEDYDSRSESDDHSSIITIDTARMTSPLPTRRQNEQLVTENVHEKIIESVVIENVQNINETIRKHDEKAEIENVDEIINTSDNLNITTNIDGSAINVTIRPPPGFHLPKKISSPPLENMNFHFNPYPYGYFNPFPAFPSPHPAHLMQSMMYFGAAAAAAAHAPYMYPYPNTVNSNFPSTNSPSVSKVSPSDLVRASQNIVHNPHNTSPMNSPHEVVSKANISSSVSNAYNNLPPQQNILSLNKLSEPNSFNIRTSNPQRIVSLNNTSESNTSTSSNNSLPTQQCVMALLNNMSDGSNLVTGMDYLSLMDKELKDRKVKNTVYDLIENLKILLIIKEKTNNEDVQLLVEQLTEIIKSIMSENVVTQLAENLIRLIKPQITKVISKEYGDVKLIENNNQCDNNQREKIVDASIQVDYTRNEILSGKSIVDIPLRIETDKLNMDEVNRKKGNELEKIQNIEKVEKKLNKDVMKNYEKEQLEISSNDLNVGNEKLKHCGEKIIEELNLSKDNFNAEDNLCTTNKSKSNFKTTVQLREFSGQKVHVIKINGEFYFITLQFMLAYTKFTDVDKVKAIFSNIKIDFPSIEFEMEEYSKVYRKLVKQKVPGCSSDSTLIQLIKLKDVPVILEKLFATNPVLVKDLHNFTNETKTIIM